MQSVQIYVFIIRIIGLTLIWKSHHQTNSFLRKTIINLVATHVQLPQVRIGLLFA